ncbi:MAG: hypothetical protein PHD29_01805 [bacterium]|nr:hypothetical protein [bacterium]MDD5354074.1 hypothetical protein [bacterium]MDD5755754.1 hypothetical protein [bacterium]
MKQVSILLLCILLWANVAFAVQTHQISQEERKSLPWWDKDRPVREEAVANPWWDKSKPVRPAVAERPWWDKERIVRPPSPIDAERSEKYANNRGKQKTTNSVKMSIKLDKLED